MASSSLPPADAPSPAQSTEGSECSYAAASASDSSNHESIGDDLASSSDDELPPLDYTSMEYVGGNAARMTLEVMLATSIRPGQRIAYDSGFGMVEFTVPSDVPGRKFRVDVVPSGNGAWRLASVHALTTADGSECSRHGSSVGGPTGGREDGDEHSSSSTQDNFAATVVAVDRAKVTIELVVPEHMQPGELIRFTPPDGMPAGMSHLDALSVFVPSTLLPGRKICATVKVPAQEKHCEDVARWALGMLRSKSPEEAGTPENSKRLCEAIDNEVHLSLLIPRLLKVRRLRATMHALTPKCLSLRLTTWCAGGVRGS